MKSVAPQFLRENFAPSDRLAIVLLDKRSGAVAQRIATAEKIASPQFQAWLHHMNTARMEVYVSMNALHESATGRTKADVAAVRHVFLDFDENGTDSVQALLKRDDVPKPNYLIRTSPDKWQVIWKVDGFTSEHAENLQRALARHTGADIAATDSARVLRLPGFNNHKYAKPYRVTHEKLSDEVYRPERFPQLPSDSWAVRTADKETLARPTTERARSQSERDWAFARRALARGESPDMVIAAIAAHRRHDKHDPRYYAELTVRKAVDSFAAAPAHASRAETPER